MSSMATKRGWVMEYEMSIWKETLGIAAFIYMLVSLNHAWAGTLF